MRYFFDTEFIEDGRTIDLISIGIVSEDDREYYGINYNCDFSLANPWVKENVLKFIPEKPIPTMYPSVSAFKASPEYQAGWRAKEMLAEELKDFLIPDDNGIEFWAYYCGYDWVVFCQLWGKMLDLPAGFPMYCNDVKQYAKHLGDPTLPQLEGEHHALNDARDVKAKWQFLRDRRYRNGIEFA